MTNKLFLALGICLMLYLPTQAQTDTTAPKRYKWEVATDLLWLINKNNIPASSIFVRRHFVTKKGKNVALRMRLGWDFNYLKIRENQYKEPKQANPSFFNYPGTGLVLTPTIVVGLEKQVALEKRLQLFYGLDLGVRIIYEDLKFADSNPTSLYFLRKYTYATYSLAALGGIKYFFHPRVAISSEMNFTATYRRDRSKTISKSYIDPAYPQFQNQSVDSDQFFLNFNPFYLLNLSLNF